jgi:hypothetical protein
MAEVAKVSDWNTVLTMPEEEAKESSYNGTEEEKVVEAEASIFQNPA